MIIAGTEVLIEAKHTGKTKLGFDMGTLEIRVDGALVHSMEFVGSRDDTPISFRCKVKVDGTSDFSSVHDIRPPKEE